MVTVSVKLDRDHWWFIVKKFEGLVRKSKWVLDNKEPKNPELLKMNLELEEGIIAEIVSQIRSKEGEEVEIKGESIKEDKKEEMAPEESQ